MLFVITQDLGNNSFEVRRYDEASSAVRKYKNAKFYLLPHVLSPSEALDAIDQRYLNINNAPIFSPLLKSM